MNRTNKIGWVGFFLCVSLWGAPYTDNGNGTVTDTATGLIWQKCSAGLGTTIGSCSTGSIATYNWSSAISYCEGLTLGGRIDWRLPNINELKSIVDYAKPSTPTIDLNAFPNTQNGTNGTYWSSNTYAQTTNNVWVVFFSFGGTGNGSKTNSYFVRCVTGP